MIPADALAQVPQYSSAARVAELAGGAVNRSFSVETPAGRFFLRLHQPAGIALGADHGREAQLQNAAAVAGLASPLVYADPRHRFAISEFIEGRLWTPADFEDLAQLRKLGVLLKKVHEIVPPIAAPFDLPALLRGFSESIAQAAPMERPLLAQLMERAEQSLLVCASESRPKTLFHSDLHHSNLIETANGRLFLLDWEYAAVGDPLFDPACVLAYYPQATPHARGLLNATGLANQATSAMLEHATWLYTLLSFFWDRARLLAAGIRSPTPAD